MKNNYSKKILAVSILITISVFVAVFVSASLLYKQIVATNNKVEQVKQSANERAKVFALKDSVEGTVKQRETLKNSLVGKEDADTAGLIDNLESLAKKNNLIYVVKSVAYESTFSGASYNNLGFLRIKMLVSGSWNEVIKFVKLLENYPKLTSISNLTLDNINNKWSAEIDFVIPKLKN